MKLSLIHIFLAALEERFFIETLETERRQPSKDGTVKYLFRLPDGDVYKRQTPS